MKPCGSLNRCAVRSLHLRTFALVLALVTGVVGAAAGDVIVTSVRIWTAPDHTRVVLDLTGSAEYEVRRVNNPERIAVNIAGGRFEDSGTIGVDDSVLQRVRRNVLGGRAQVVLDLKGDVRWRHFPLRAAGGRPDRIVVDVFHATDAAAEGSPTAAPDSVPSDVPDEFIVVIDPGHGGLDPGAIRAGVREKDVVLDIARELQRLIDEREGCRAVLTRDGDYFVRLADRVSKAKEVEGDLFVSIHANSHERSSLCGMEVFFLSRGRADDRESQVLADRENAADLVGLAPEEHDDDSVLEILVDLRSSQVLSSSNRLADQIIGAARRSNVVGARSVKQEVFRVLQSLVMPSSLVEVAYLTNEADRTLLASAAGRRSLAGVLAEGIFAYMGESDPDHEQPRDAWATLYRIRGGDTLWMLARRHRTTVDEIRRHNDLRTDMLAVGQQLTLP